MNCSGLEVFHHFFKLVDFEWHILARECIHKLSFQNIQRSEDLPTQ